MKALHLFFLFLLATVSGMRVSEVCAEDEEEESIPSLAGLFDDNDFVVLAEWVRSSKPEDKDDSGLTVYRIRKIAQNFRQKIKTGDEAFVFGYRKGKVGDLAVIAGYVSNLAGGKILWHVAERVTPAAYKYLTEAPNRLAAPAKRLEYFGKFLDHSDPAIAIDAGHRFGSAPFKDIARAAAKLPRESVRKWFIKAHETGHNWFLYTLLLGMRGTKDDIPLVKKQIEITDFPPPQVSILYASYLMLSGPDGLKHVEVKLNDDENSFTEVYGILNSLRFIRRNCPDRIPPTRINQSVRLLLDRPPFVDYAISDLQAAKDWSVHGRLVKMFPDATKTTQRAIIRYMFACSKDTPQKPLDKSPKHVLEARKHLETFRKIAPKRVEEVERFLSF